MQAMNIAHQQQLQQLQPNIKGFASPSITPSNNFRVGQHQPQSHAFLAKDNNQVNLSINSNTNNNNNGGGVQARNMTNSNIHGRRIDSPELKVAVNREIQDHRPHTAGHSFLQYNQASAAPGGNQLAYYKNDEFFTIMNKQQHQSGATSHQQFHSAMNSAHNTISLSNNHFGHNSTSTNGMRQRGGQPSQSNKANACNQNQDGAIRSGRHQKMPSKSQNPHQRKKKHETQRSVAPKSNQFINNNIQTSIVNTQAQQVINIHIQNAKMSNLKPVAVVAATAAENLNQGGGGNALLTRKRMADPTRFNQHGSGLMSAPNKSKSRSLSQKRRQEVKNVLAVPPSHKPANHSILTQPKGFVGLKPPRQHNNMMNRSSINHPRDTLEIGMQDSSNHNEIGFSFENKENDSINYNEFSPSRITDGAKSGVQNIHIRGQRGHVQDFVNLLDSDSSLSSPKNIDKCIKKQNHGNGPKTSQNYLKDKISFIKHFSPDRNSISHHPHDIHSDGNVLSLSERDRRSSREVHYPVKASIQSGENLPAGPPDDKNQHDQNNSKANIVTTSHRLKILDKMTKQKYKQIRAKEEADDLSRRKMDQDQLIQKQLQKKAEQQQISQRAAAANKMKLNISKIQQAAVAAAQHKHKNSQLNSGLINVNKVSGNYKKKRSKSCMNKADNIFGGHPRFKEHQQQVLHHLHHQQHQNREQNLNIMYFAQKEEINLKHQQETQPKQPSQQHQKRREKSVFQEMQDIKRQCLEELKKAEGLPNNSAAAFASNKRQSNLTTITQQKDSKQNQSAKTQTNQQSNGDLNTDKRNNSRGKDGINPNTGGFMLNPSITSKIKKFIEKKKKMGGYIPKSLEQTIVNEKKLKIQNNLAELQKNIKNQHLRHSSFNFVFKKSTHEGAQMKGSSTSMNASVLPEKNLKTQFFKNNVAKQLGKKPPNVFVYQSEILNNHHQKDHSDGRIVSNSLTPVRASGKSRIPENDLSLEMQQDYQKLLNSIQKAHDISHPHGCSSSHAGGHVSHSNPPILNRKYGGVGNHPADQNSGVGQTDSFSFDVSSIGHRDSSYKQEKRRFKKDTSKPGKKSVGAANISLVDELEQRHNRKQKEQQKNRTWIHERISGSSSKDRRSNSSPNTIHTKVPLQDNNNEMSSIAQSNYEVKSQVNLDRKSVNLSIEQKKVIQQSDQGSSSYQGSQTRHDLQRKIKMLAQKYGPHIQYLMHDKGYRSGRISNTQMLQTLHSAAIMIQQYFRKYLAKKGFYNDSFIDSCEDEEDENLENQGTIQNYRKQPDQILMAHLSPLRTKPAILKQIDDIVKEVKPQIIPQANQFYSASSSINEKVIQLSVISSGRPDHSAGYPIIQNEEKADIKTNYIPLRSKPIHMLDLAPQSVPSSLPQSGFSTAIKNPNAIREQVQMTQYIIEEEKVAQSPKFANKINQSPVDSASKEGGQEQSSSRRNAVPLLNLSQLGIPKSESQQQKQQIIQPSLQFHEERKHDASLQPKTLFDRHSFQQFYESHSMTEQYPHMLQMREEAIRVKEETEKTLLKKQLHSKELTPRTYNSKKRDLEVWVTKEKEEVKKSRKVLEQEWQKTQHMLSEMERNQEAMKRLMIDQGAPSTHRSRYGEDQHFGGDTLNSYRQKSESHRIHSSRHTATGQNFLDVIAQHVAQDTLQAVIDQSNKSTNNDKTHLNKDNSSKSSFLIATSIKNEQIAPPASVKQESQSSLTSSDIALLNNENVKEKQDLIPLNEKRTEQQEELKINEQDDTDFISFIPVNESNFSNKHPTTFIGGGGKIKVVDTLLDDFDDDDEEEEDDGSFLNDGLQKILQRTRGSMQLPQINNNEDESQAAAAEDVTSKQQNEREQQSYLVTSPGGFLSEEITLSNDFRKHIIEISQDGDGIEGAALQPPSSLSPGLKDQLKNENFFMRDFENGNAQNIIDQVKQQNISPSNEFHQKKISPNIFEHDQEVQKIITQNHDQIEEIKMAPLPPTPSPDHERPGEINRQHVVFDPKDKPTELDEIDIQLPDFPISPNDFSNVAVSPASNSDIQSDTVVSGHNVALDTRIIIGGGSLNSTLSAGENGNNQDLVQVIHEVAEEEEKVQDIQQDNFAAQITDEIFQNLMGELRLDLELLLLNDPRVRSMVHREENKGNNQRLEDSGRFPIFDRRGIQTDLFAIERYVEEILQEVLMERTRFMHDIMQPISKNPREVLNQLQNSEIGSYEHFEQHYPPCLPLDTYLRLERRRKELRERERQAALAQSDSNEAQISQAVAETRNFLYECEHIHNKVLFDCINDSLLQFKPYAKDGQPLPWSRQNRKLKPIEDFTIEEMFEIVKHDLFRWAIMQAGTLPRREFVFGGQFDEELFAEIREKKLATLLAREMIENEPRWLNYEFEQAQVNIDIGDMILEQLVTETITILNERMGGSNVPAASSITDIMSSFTNRGLL